MLLSKETLLRDKVHVHICNTEFHTNQIKDVENTNSFMTQNKVLLHYASIHETLKLL
jgi:hypothetical protein